jgi:hypothetical protein
VSSFDDFFTQGLRDAERRLPLLRPIRPCDQEQIVSIVRSSRFFRFVDRWVDLIQRACVNSIAVDRVRRTWTGIEVAQQRLMVGLGLMAAALVHVGLVWWHEAPPSWLWLILPALATALGVLLLMFASTERKEHG